ncbi:monovalent cation:proton antiporter-2 (CPA2) family protein [Xanthomonas hortorum]|uniref:Glutathione-regulated potassium-efflux system protein KefC n=2 Tax=Xanthomonas hortorum TaxID=56454 RepID=A0A6V7CZR2_9XANT|nr:monovalent cation:proton antiporter-2 (CPA2) family protein [Xanthomonas hortorum]MCE4356037.1 monovalent cation:proton antiporter-2 (CPA2) family protein [Xanthomonas hortorum pv. pelargonii]MCM5524433.1 monovalent cation:proton antiporter-2 (CPA2) family protein [Xanthomonas hortorum pv. pelargonii]MCM5536648.1 monovalent cation:proton antiporter-2 (CPA2) family protein [Xanthomonas hortorum pv. pelargonii]MCM5540787.1 monovalent cation:proton antiporter-2 (CPA2) family protein [Xanthomona
MSQAAESSELINVVVLLGAAVVAIPLFRRLGLGSVLGYLAAGLAIGPFGLGLFDEPQAILHVAELGVVMFLFVIGLEMRPSHLWSLRKEIFGLGTAQIAVCTLVLTGIGMLLGFAPPVAFVAASGFVLTSTAVVMQLLAERGDVALPPGQKIVAILLFEDLLIVPLLAIVAWMGSNGDPQAASQRWQDIGIGLACIVGLLVAGRWLLNPLFRILAASKAREVMTAAALLVVLGAALLMQVGGLSMAMGAFLAGVLLSESTFRHQIEADIEPFRGILLGLFFLGVGMSLDLHVVAADWQLIAAGVLALMVGKGVCIYAVARLMRSDHRQALDRGVLMAQGGEFAFVLFAAASASGVIDAQVNASLTAIVVVSMALTPLFVLLQRRLTPAAKPSLEGVEAVNGQTGSVLIIGFGRFGQVASQSLLARDVDVTIIDNDIEMIQSAEEFGFKIYYGDGTRLDVLHASGAHSARAIAVCVDSPEAANRIVELATREFPHARLLVRSYDREHSLQLVAAGVDYQIRETFESAVAFGQAALVELGMDEDEAVTIAREIRRRDAERFELEIAAGNTRAGAVSGLMYGNITPTVPKPTPFTPPRRESRTLNPDAVPQANQVEEATGD